MSTANHEQIDLDATLTALAHPTRRALVVTVEIDPQVGGAFRFVDRRDGEDVAHVGKYLEIDRPRRLAFEFAVPQYSPVVTRVTVAISPAAEGCELTLVHEGVLPEWAERTEEGWTKILGGLATVLAAGS